MKVNLEEKILQVFAKNVKKSKRKAVSLEANFQKHLGLDSMRLVAILLQFEEMFQIDLTEIEAELAEIRTIGDLVSLAERLELG